MFVRPLPWLLLLVLCASPARSADAVEAFERDVRPLLVERCGMCHGPALKTGGVDLTTPEGLRAADHEIGLLRADEPERSRLLAVLGWDEKVKMPPAGKLEPTELAVLDAWLRAGAALPAAHDQPAPSGVVATAAERAAHWAFQPVAWPAAPEVRAVDWVSNDVDRFILARLEEAGLEPPAEADKLTLLRRAKYDLHGLPPSPEEVEQYLADSGVGAYERLIDRLLASPRYGEKWGRHWLDVARYAETGGIDENIAYREAWRYREYVIDSFNRDTPFDQLIVEQLAGDLLPAPAGQQVNYRGRIATGFLALGPKAIVEQDKTKQLYDAIDEQIDTVSKAFLGLTIACARCHDHKFDPISTQDYYSMAGIFRSARLYEQLEGRSSKIHLLPLVPDDTYLRYKRRQDEIAAKKLEIEAIIEPEVTDSIYRERHPRLADYMLAAWKVEPRGRTPTSWRSRRTGPDGVGAAGAVSGPDGSFRPYLKKWREAQAADAPTLAAEYAAMIREPAERWRGILAKWSGDVLRAIERANSRRRRSASRGSPSPRSPSGSFERSPSWPARSMSSDRADGALPSRRTSARNTCRPGRWRGSRRSKAKSRRWRPPPSRCPR